MSSDSLRTWTKLEKSLVDLKAHTQVEEAALY